MTTKMTPDLFQEKARNFKRECKKLVMGNDHVFDLIIYALSTDGHVLLQSVPGLGKTVIGASVGATLKNGKWRFFQFSSDMLPSDVRGSEIFNEELKKMVLQYGALHPALNFLLADELNRAMPKTVSALLAPMEERKITIGEHEITLPDPFLIIATQNPIEQEGTYELPEASLDRFSVMGRLAYVTADEEFQLLMNPAIYQRNPQGAAKIDPVLTPDDVLAMREFVLNEVTIAPNVLKYLINLVRATRKGKCEEADKWLGDYKDLVAVGASQRTSKWMVATSKAAAALRGSDTVQPRDVKSVFVDCCAHKFVLSPEAKATSNPDEVALEIAEHLLKVVPTNE